MIAAITRNWLTVWSVPAITDTLVQPTTLFGSSLDLYAMACRGQYVPLSFCIRSRSDCTVRLKFMENDNQECPYVDLSWVKAWWQSPVRMGGTEPVMLPELLLKDPTLITPRPDKTNEVRSPVLDTDEIQPLKLTADTTQQVWALVEVPQYLASKRYPLTIQVTVDGTTFDVPVVVDVLPFELAELAQSPLDYCCYYRGRMFGVPNHEYRTRRQFTAELVDIAQHGFNRVVLYDDLNDMYRTPTHLKKLLVLLDAYRNSGIPMETLHAIFTPMVRYTYRDQITNETRRLLSILRNHGVETLYAHSRDEPSPEQMHEGLPKIQAARAGGAKVFTALIGNSEDAMSILGANLDLALFSSPCIGTEDIDEWHAIGSKVWYYHVSDAPSGETYYRRRYGFDAYAKGFDGCSIYAYQHTFGPSPWNDMDDYHADHVLGYHTDGGPVGTLQWEACREAINDMRYLQTLLEHGGTVPVHEDRDLNEVRTEMTRDILTR